MNQDNWMVIIRLVLHIGGTFATTLGWLPPDSVNEITANILAIIGPIMNTIGLIWTAWTRRPSALVATAVALPHVEAITVNNPAVAAAAKAADPTMDVTTVRPK